MSNRQKIATSLTGCFQMLWGAVFTLVGLHLLLAALQGQSLNGEPLPEGTSGLGQGLLSLPVLIAGLMALGGYRLVFRLWNHATRGNPAFWNGLAMGLVPTLAGAALMVISVIDPRDAAFHTPRFVVTAAGATFFTVGSWIIKIEAIDRGVVNNRSTANDLLSATLLTAFGITAAGAALSPETEGATSAGAGSPLCFLPGALILGGLAAWLWIRVIRRLRE